MPTFRVIDRPPERALLPVSLFLHNCVAIIEMLFAVQCDLLVASEYAQIAGYSDACPLKRFRVLLGGRAVLICSFFTSTK